MIAISFNLLFLNFLNFSQNFSLLSLELENTKLVGLMGNYFATMAPNLMALNLTHLIGSVPNIRSYEFIEKFKNLRLVIL